MSTRNFARAHFLYNENPTIVAGFYKGFADEQKTNKKSAENVLMSKAPVCCRSAKRICGELSAKLTEGLCSSVFLLLQSLRHFLAKMPPPFTQGRLDFSPARAGIRNKCMAGRPIKSALVRSRYY